MIQNLSVEPKCLRLVDDHDHFHESCHDNLTQKGVMSSQLQKARITHHTGAYGVSTSVGVTRSTHSPCCIILAVGCYSGVMRAQNISLSKSNTVTHIYNRASYKTPLKEKLDFWFSFHRGNLKKKIILPAR